jgi:hypothetical protein
MSTMMDMLRPSLFYDLNVIAGWSMMMTETWHAALPWQGFAPLATEGKVMLTKFWIRVPSIDFGRLAFTL